MPNVTQLLESPQRGDRQAAADLLPVVYEKLRNLAAVRELIYDEDYAVRPEKASIFEYVARSISGPWKASSPVGGSKIGDADDIRTLVEGTEL